MRRVEVEIEECQVEKNGRPVPGVSATCGDCDHCVEVMGHGAAAESSALKRLQGSCPLRESNRYVILRNV